MFWDGAIVVMTFGEEQKYEDCELLIFVIPALVDYLA